MKTSALTRRLLKVAGRKAASYVGRKVYKNNPFNIQDKVNRISKYLKGGNRTKTAEKRNNNKRKLYVGRGELNANEIHINAKGKKIAKTSGTWTYQQTHSGFITSSAGTQGTLELCSVNTPSQCLVSSGIGFTNIQNHTALEVLNPNITNTGGGVMSAVTVPPEDQFCIKKNFIDIEMTNMSGVACYLDLYIVKTKKIHTFAPLITWDGGYVNEAFGQPAETMPGPGGAVLNLNTYTAGYMTRSVVGTNPMDSPVFRSTYKIVTKKNIILAGGVTEKLKITIALNKVIKRDVANAYIAATTPYPPWVYTVFTVARGQVVADRTDTAHVTPTYGPVDIAYIANVRTACCAVANQQGKLSTNRGAMLVPIGALPANLSYINEETDAATTVAASTVV